MRAEAVKRFSSQYCNIAYPRAKSQNFLFKIKFIVNIYNYH